MKHIVQCSFGVNSWAAAKLVAARYGTDDLIQLFADTTEEDEDTYRWGRAAAANVGGELVEIMDGRGIWEVFRDSKFIGNSRADPCSRILKREICAKWLKDNGHGPTNSILYFGIHSEEIGRLPAIRDRHKPQPVGFPLCDPEWKPWRSQVPRDPHAWAEREGLPPQLLYRLGFSHANCGGRCVKAGQEQWRLYLRHFPERFARDEAKEQEMRETLGKDVSILRDRRGGKVKPLTLRQFRENVEAGHSMELFNTVGGCNCFTPDEDSGATE